MLVISTLKRAAFGGYRRRAAIRRCCKRQVLDAGQLNWAACLHVYDLRRIRIYIPSSEAQFYGVLAYVWIRPDNWIGVLHAEKGIPVGVVLA
jgi:hypothetical protein